MSIKISNNISDEIKKDVIIKCYDEKTRKEQLTDYQKLGYYCYASNIIKESASPFSRKRHEIREYYILKFTDINEFSEEAKKTIAAFKSYCLLPFLVKKALSLSNLILI